MLESKIGLFENLPIFRGLTRKQLGSIVDVATKAFFNEGDYLLTRNQPGHSAFLIITGSARCLHFPGTPSTGEPVGPGSLLGEMAMLVDTVHALSVQATERVRAVAIHREALKRAMLQEPAIAQTISDNLLERLHGFAGELRRLDALFAEVETSASQATIPRNPSLGKATPVQTTQFLPKVEPHKKYKRG